MKCIKCKSENFTLETTVIVTEKYKIYKNGRVSDHPVKTEYDNQDMADNDNIVRCDNCKQGYVIKHQGRNDLLRKINFNDIALTDEDLTEY